MIDGDALSEAATSLSIRTHVWRKAAEICDGFPESVYRYVCATAPTTIEEFYASRYIPGILSLYHPDIMTVAMESTQRVLWALRSVIELGGLRGKDRAAVLCVANQLGLEASANETLMLWRGDRTALFEGLPTSSVRRRDAPSSGMCSCRGGMTLRRCSGRVARFGLRR